MQGNNKRLIIRWLSRISFSISCTFLYIVSLLILASVIINIIKDLFSKNFAVFNLLDEVGLIIFSIAVFDVSNYLLEEEVLKDRSIREPKQSRKALMKFILIIFTALSLEGLVLTIEVAKTDISNLFYPISLLITAIICLIGLGIFIKLNASTKNIRQNNSDSIE